MSFKQMLKMKLPFTRKGLEDYLEEMKLELIAHDNALFAQVSAQVSAQVVDIIETMNKLKKDIAGKRVIVRSPTLDWRKTLFQRPQQLAAAYAKKEAFR